MVYYRTEQQGCGLRYDKRALDRFDEVTEAFEGIGNDDVYRAAGSPGC